MRATPLVANLLVWASVVVGLVASTTAYSPRLDAIPVDLPEEELLVLGAPAGVQPGDPRTPLYGPGTVLTAEVVEALRANRRPGAPDEPTAIRVKVKSFDLGRWDHWWAFLVAAAGLVGGAVLFRTDAKRTAAASIGRAANVDPTVATGAAFGDATTPPHAAEGPERALAEARAELDALVRDVAEMRTDQARTDAIIERVGRVQRTHFAAFVDDRPVLTARFGVGGYARIMDRFASAERILNRAWSAAADRVAVEAIECLHEGVARLADAERELRAG